MSYKNIVSLSFLMCVLTACGVERLIDRNPSQNADSDSELELTKGQVSDLKNRFDKSKAELKRLALILDQVDSICDFVENFNKDVTAALASISSDSKALVERLASLKIDLATNGDKLKEIDTAVSKDRGAIAAKQTLINAGPEADFIKTAKAAIAAALKQIARDRKDIKAIEKKMLALPESAVYAKLSDQRDALHTDIIKQKKIITDLRIAIKSAKKLNAQEIAALRAEIIQLQAEIDKLRLKRTDLAVERAAILAAIVAAQVELKKLSNQDGKIGTPFDLPKECLDIQEQISGEFESKAT